MCWVPPHRFTPWLLRFWILFSGEARIPDVKHEVEPHLCFFQKQRWAKSLILDQRFWPETKDASSRFRRFLIN